MQPREPTGCSRIDGKHPDGMTLIPWLKGKTLVWDFTCVDTFASSYQPEVMSVSGFAAKIAEDRKRRKYNLLPDHILFIPVAIETTGVWGKEGLLLLRSIGERMKVVTGESSLTSFLLQRISLAIQRGNTASILGTLPPGKTLDEIYYF